MSCSVAEQIDSFPRKVLTIITDSLLYKKEPTIKCLVRYAVTWDNIGQEQCSMICNFSQNLNVLSSPPGERETFTD